MKFLHLRQSLERALGASAMAGTPAQSSSNASISSPPFYPGPSPRQAVLKDGTAHDPVDRNARLAICKAPWWAHLIYGQTSKSSGSQSAISQEPKSELAKEHRKSQVVHCDSRPGKSQTSTMETKKKSVGQAGPEIAAANPAPKKLKVPKVDRAEVIERVTFGVTHGYLTPKQAENLLENMGL